MKRLFLICTLSLACAPGLPGPGGGASSVSPRSGVRWDPEHLRPDPVPAGPSTTVAPPELLARRNALTLTDVVDIALQNSPTTRISWSNARAAAARLGSARGDYLPTATVDLRGNRQQTAGASGTSPVRQQSYGATASFTWILFGFEREGDVSSARHALAAADWTHNAAIQDVVLQVGSAYYTYAATKALLLAQQATKAEADTNLAAAMERQRVGLATIAEVLQARTAAAQALLDLQRTEGEVLATRGALAVATGYPATSEFDVDSTAGSGAIGAVADSVESLIALAKASRPDIAAAAATWQASRADARAAMGRRLPSITATGNSGRTYLTDLSTNVETQRQSWLVGIGISIPIFNGFSWEYDAEAAREVARAQGARAEQLSQRAVLEVFTDYYGLRTATQSVRTTDDLYTAAVESADAARGRYRAGVGSLLELLTAESALGNARALRVQSRLSWHVALLQLAHDVGVLDPHGGSTLRLIPDSSSSAPSQ